MYDISLVYASLLYYMTCYLIDLTLLCFMTCCYILSFHNLLKMKYHHLIMLSLDTKHDTPILIIITITGM